MIPHVEEALLQLRESHRAEIDHIDSILRLARNGAAPVEAAQPAAIESGNGQKTRKHGKQRAGDPIKWQISDAIRERALAFVQEHVEDDLSNKDFEQGLKISPSYSRVLTATLRKEGVLRLVSGGTPREKAVFRVREVALNGY